MTIYTEKWCLTGHMHGVYVLFGNPLFFSVGANVACRNGIAVLESFIQNEKYNKLHRV